MGMTKAKPRMNSSGIPYGCGSLQLRANYYWMIYYDAEGNRHQANTWATTEDEARSVLAIKAIDVQKARLAALEQLI